MSGQATIGKVITQALREGKNNQEVLATVLNQYPDARTSVASISWYRSSLRKEGVLGVDGEKIPSIAEIKRKRRDNPPEAEVEDDLLG